MAATWQPEENVHFSINMIVVKLFDPDISYNTGNKYDFELGILDRWLLVFTEVEKARVGSGTGTLLINKFHMLGVRLPDPLLYAI